MHKWLISGSDGGSFRITKTDMDSQETQSFDSDGPSTLLNALGFVAENGNCWDLIFLPNSTVLAVANKVAAA